MKRTRQLRVKGERSRMLQIVEEKQLFFFLFYFEREWCHTRPFKGVYMNKCMEFLVHVKCGGQLNVRGLRVLQKTRISLLKSEL